MNEIKRKLFHLLGLGYLAGIYFIPRSQLLLSLGGLLAAAFLIEIVRLQPNRLSVWMGSMFSSILREHETKRFSGFFWMVLGVFTTVLLLVDKNLSMTCVAYLIFGDTIAALAGRAIKGIKWPGTKKTVAGSTACFIVCTLVGLFFIGQASWVGVLMGAFVGTFLEALGGPFDDNFLIPAGAAFFFRMWF